MNKENEFKLNLSHNSYEDVPIISISNKSKSKSNSSNNTNKINNLSSKKKFNIVNNNKTKKTEKSFSVLTAEQNSLIPFYDNSFNENKNLSINNKSKSRSEKKGEITPKKNSDKYNNILMENLKNKKKDVLNIDNIHGKNLMEYFEKMRENIDTEEKDKNRVSSVGNKQKISLNLKNNNINNINKSWNKNKYCFLNIAQKPIKIQIKNTMNNFNNTSYIKNLQNLLSQKNINIDLKSLINKNRPSLKKNLIKSNDIKNDIKKDKKIDFEKIKFIPKSDIQKRKLSFSHLKLRETVMKNLFHDNNNFKKKDEINNPNKYIGNNEKINKIFSTQKKIISNKNNNNNNKVGIKKINNYEEFNPYYLKYKGKIEFKSIQKQINIKALNNNKLNNKKNIK